MIGRRKPPMDPVEPEPKGFDDFDLRLGDIMRGERATIGKSLLDVQRELKIKATYIAAIENADVSAFETPGFIAGYVRSYSRYLGLDPDWAYATFCHESGYAGGTTLDKGGAGPTSLPAYRKTGPAAGFDTPGRDPIAQPRVSFAPETASPFANVEPRALGSTLVLLGLVGAIGYGGWSVLQEIQRVQVTPVDRAPAAIAEVDPLDGATFAEADIAPGQSGIAPATPDALDRLYRPQALDVPVMISRDGPIASLDPTRVGTLGAENRAGPGPELFSSAIPAAPQIDRLGAGPTVPTTQEEAIAAALNEANGGLPGVTATTPRVTAEGLPEVMLVAVGEVWLSVKSADGTIIKEQILQDGDTYIVPPTEIPPTLRVGSAGNVYFAVNGVTYGPAGERGAVRGQIALGAAGLTQEFAVVDRATAGDVDRKAVAVAEAALGLAPQPLSE